MVVQTANKIRKIGKSKASFQCFFGGLLCLVALNNVQALAADLPKKASKPVEYQAAKEGPASGWQFRISPYAWLIGLDGHQTVRGKSVSLNANFRDIWDATAGQGGSLVGLMLDVEARNGPYALMGDFVGIKINAKRSRSVVRGIGATGVEVAASGAVDVDYKTMVAEAAGAFEFAKMGNLAFDVLGGARYWHQTADLKVGLSVGASFGDFQIGRDFAVMRSGTVNWVDGFAGMRMRWAFAPGQELTLRGDIGGGGSRFTWQGIAAYNFTITEHNSVTYKGVVGYRALYADYAKGEGRSRYEYDMTTHGPLVGLQVTF